jgi:hypothetical protein
LPGDAGTVSSQGEEFHMRRPILLAGVLLVVSCVLGATVFRDQVASAGSSRRAGPPPTTVVFSNGLGTTTGNTVKIDPANNTVAVASSEASPVTITNANDGQDPVHFTMTNQWVGPTVITGETVPVPAGKTLVIENVSADIQAPTGTHIAVVALGDAYDGELTFLTPVLESSDPSHDYYTAFEPVRAYVKAGDELQGVVGATADISPATGAATFLVNGYLVNAP